MKLKSEGYRHIIFLILIISGTILSYNTWFRNDKSKEINESELKDELKNPDMCKNEIEAENHFGFFIKYPNSEKGINSLFKAIVYWDMKGNDSSVQHAIKKFDLLIKDDSLKNNFYSRLGKYYITAHKKLGTNLREKSIGDITVWLNLKNLPIVSGRDI